MCCHGYFIYKSKMNNKILINAAHIGKDLLKSDVREPKLANTDDTLVYLKLWANDCQMVLYKKF